MGYSSSMRMRFTCPSTKKGTTLRQQLAFIKKIATLYKRELCKEAASGNEVGWYGPYFANTIDYALDNNIKFSGDEGDFQLNYRAEVNVDKYYAQVEWDGKFSDDKWLKKLMDIIKENGGSYSFVRLGEEAGDIEELSAGDDSDQIRVEFYTTTSFCD